MGHKESHTTERLNWNEWNNAYENRPLYGYEVDQVWEQVWYKVSTSSTAAAAAKSLQLCLTLCYTRDGSPPGSPSLGFSRQEHWSGLPFPSPVHASEKWKWGHLAMSNSSVPHGLQPTRLLCSWDFPGKSTRVSLSSSTSSTAPPNSSWITKWWLCTWSTLVYWGIYIVKARRPYVPKACRHIWSSSHHLRKSDRSSEISPSFSFPTYYIISPTSSILYPWPGKDSTFLQPALNSTSAHALFIFWGACWMTGNIWGMEMRGWKQVYSEIY